MNKYKAILLNVLLTLGLVVSTMAAEKPNIIIIFNDDQGYQDLGCFGSPLILAPLASTK